MSIDNKREAEILEAVNCVLNGSTKSFSKIVKIYKNPVFRIALSFLGSREEAEDAVQEIFLRAYKSLNSFILGKSFKAWLYSIAFNYLKTGYGKIIRFKKLTEKLRQSGISTMITQEIKGPDAEAEESETESKIRKAVILLPDNLKEAVVLYYLEEQSIDETASALGISRENAKSRLHRARKKLREILENSATEKGIKRYNINNGK